MEVLRSSRGCRQAAALAVQGCVARSAHALQYSYQHLGYQSVAVIDWAGPRVSLPGPRVSLPGPRVSLPGPRVSLPGPRMSLLGPRVSLPGPIVSLPGPDKKASEWYCGL